MSELEMMMILEPDRVTLAQRVEVEWQRLMSLTDEAAAAFPRRAPAVITVPSLIEIEIDLSAFDQRRRARAAAY